MKTLLIALGLTVSISSNAEEWSTIYQNKEYLQHAYARKLSDDVTGARFEKYFENGTMTFTIEHFNCKEGTQKLVSYVHYFADGQLDFSHRPDVVTNQFKEADKNPKFLFACFKF
jgi:hypothetical protein